MSRGFVGPWAMRAVALGVTGILASAAPAKRYLDMTDDELNQAIVSAHQVKDLGQRIQSVTDPFVGTPYVLGNMGEGPDGDGRDVDPRFNVKTTDCTTFVEHAMAFALASDLPQARKTLDAIRYSHGVVNYGTRRHWPEAQWVKGLAEEGWLEDATARIAGKDVTPEMATVDIDNKTFLASAHAKSMPLKPEEVPKGSFSVPFIPMAAIPKVAARLEAGMVINIVKAPKEGVLVRISHQGLVVKRGGKVFIRNASSVGSKSCLLYTSDAADE